MKRYIEILICIVCVFGCVAGTNAEVDCPWGTIVVDEQPESLQLAVVDLQRYIGQVTGTVPILTDSRQWRQAPDSAVVLGTFSGNSLLSGMGFSALNLSEQGFILANGMLDGQTVLIAAGHTEIGAVNAIYGLLREMGFGFYLGSEAIPQTLPPRLPNSPQVYDPAFTTRGILPWYNFLLTSQSWW